MGLENDGGGIIMLPTTKHQVSEKLSTLNKPKLSKSQKRKLKKLEEEKGNEMLLSKSMETLEKNAINRELAQVETVGEKRRREVEFAKAGLQLPDSDQPFAKRRTENASHGAEVFDEKIQSPANNAQSSLAERVILNDTTISVGSSENEDEVDGYPKYKLNRVNKREGDCCSARELVAPTLVHVTRPDDVEKQRMGLPIVMMEQEIMEAINENSSVIIRGETGCGKTTQVPQFLYEAGFGSNHLNAPRGGIIGVTQPRRVAVLATAKRVAYELGVQLGKEVGFQVRHDRDGEKCSIKFMTDGILLRQLQSDFLLRRYSVIILDEAHERTLNTDILIGMLSKVIQLRQIEYEEQQKRILEGETIECGNRIYPLKLVLMSATLRVEDFVSGTRIFPEPPPVIEVPTRQYQVTAHFSKKTDEKVDYINQAFEKVLSIHKRLPHGGILVFITGQREVERLCKKLRLASREIVAKVVKGSNKTSSISEEENHTDEIREEFEYQENSVREIHEITERFSSYMEEDGEDLSEDESDLNYNSNEESDREDFSEDGVPFSEQYAEEDESSCPGPLRVLPLYAMLDATSQLRVFEEGSEGERLVVVATNVAETSLTIPGIKYVVDTGKEKVKNYNSCNGIETYEIQWISKASAAQRKGRAGRTRAGRCYRLYSSAAFGNSFPDFSQAQISKVPVDEVVLLMKSMDIPEVANFPFPTPPENNALIEAARRLKVLEALDEKGGLTPLGKAMARYPMSPRHSRMLLTVIQNVEKCCSRPNLVLAYAVAAAAALSLSNPFVMLVGQNQDDDDDDDAEEDSNKKKKPKLSRAKFSNPNSDALTTAFALQCFEVFENQESFCEENSLHKKTMEEMSKLRKQLLQLVFSDSKQPDEFSWNHGTLKDVECAWRFVSSSNKNGLQQYEEEILCKAIFAGWADRVARRIKGGERKVVGGIQYQACMVEETVFLHRRSSTSKSPPEFLVYTELLQQAKKRPYIHGATSVKPYWLPQYAPFLCSFSAPLSHMKPYYDPISDQVFSWSTPTFGPHHWELPPHSLPIEDESTRVAVFAYSLLQGQVLPCLRHVQHFMAAKPESILKPESRGHKRVGNLLSKLNTKGRAIDSCAKLRALWRKNPKELFSEIEDWFQDRFRIWFEELWVEMIRQVFLDPEERFPERVGKKKRT